MSEAGRSSSEQAEEIESVSPADGEAARPPRTLIRPERGWQPIDLAELWRYRELLYFFAWRDIKVRYKQAELGIIWAVLEPLLTTGVFVVLFGLFLRKGEAPGASGVPYALSTFCAMLPWQLFAQSVARSSESLIQGQNLVTKVYFPRMILPASAVLTALVDFAVVFVVLVVMMACYGVYPGWAVLTLPLFAIMAVMASLALGLWLSALAAIYRDFRYAQPVLVRLGMYLSPVVYATASLEGKVPEWVLAIYGLNPMAGVIEGFRWALLGAEFPLGVVLVPSALMTAVFLLSGVYFFRRMERIIADVI